MHMQQGEGRPLAYPSLLRDGAQCQAGSSLFGRYRPFRAKLDQFIFDILLVNFRDGNIANLWQDMQFEWCKLSTCFAVAL